MSSEEVVDSTSIERHLVYLLNAVEPVAGEISELRCEHDLQVDFFCYWASATGHGGPELTPRTLGRIAALEAELGFDFYDLSPEEPD